MKAIVIILCFVFCCIHVFGRHGKGGSITYEYLGNGGAPGTSQYRVTVKHYIDCEGTAFIETNVYLGIFNGSTNRFIRTVIFGQTSKTTIQKKSFSACINPKPVVCYVVVTYVTTIDLEDNAEGYVLAEQECCRIGGIINIQNSSTVGVTNINRIPGVIGGVSYRKNSSPVYAQRDTAVICHNAYFTIDFSATDEDGDELTYAFCAAKPGGTIQNRQPNPPGTPPYRDITYAAGYSAEAPLGPRVTIDGKTGIISGTAPDKLGSYVISVCVSEFRDGHLIGVTKKEVQVSVADCSLAAATLQSTYLNCENFDLKPANLSFSDDVDYYKWDFGVRSSDTDTSSLATPAFTYPDTGVYVLKLKVSSKTGCEDSTTAKVHVYPGFSPGFTASGSCYQSPFVFTDTTYARYGTVESWKWDFGDNSGIDHTNSLKSPSHLYPASKDYTVKLSVRSSKGCSATVYKIIAATEKPLLHVPFRDTLICSKDSLDLHVKGSGLFSWLPNRDILGGNTADPTVFPKRNTRYVVTVTEKGCVTSDSINVRVVDQISLAMPADTTICKGDELLLKTQSDAISYQWVPATGLDNASISKPTARISQPVTYNLFANLGSCEARGSVQVKVADYPKVQLPADTFLCSGNSVVLHAVSQGAFFNWTPSNSLSSAHSLHPLATPRQTVAYVLSVTDTLGCPKPVKDTVVVRVIEPVKAFAGNDTSVIANQPLHLQATGGVSYEWSPSSGLSNPKIANPVATFTPYHDSVIYRVRVSSAEGCFAEDNITVRVFKTAAGIFVPNGFTPNGDGLNDQFRPYLVGIKKLNYFRIFNRWGQLLFSTSEPGRGWDGRLNGTLQQTGNFVYMAEGVDYTGKLVQKKGSFLLLH